MLTFVYVFLSTTIDISSSATFDELRKKDLAVFFHAANCTVCKTFYPIWSDMAHNAERNFDNLSVRALNCSDDALVDVCHSENVSATPSIKTFKNNESAFYGGVNTDDAFDMLFYYTYSYCGPDRLDRCRDEDRRYIMDIQQLDAKEMLEKQNELSGDMKARYDKYTNSLRKLHTKMQQLKEDTQRDMNTHAFRLSLIEAVKNDATTTSKDEL
jgi:hypothetical protein